MNRIKHLLRNLATLIRVNLWLIPVIAALVVAVFYFAAPPPPMSATMATGVESDGHVVFAGKLRENLKEWGFELKLVPSAGSCDNLEHLLGTGEVDIALVQSGQERQLEAGQARQLQTFGVVYQEPLWLFHRSNVHIDQLDDLLHLRLAIDDDGSDTRAAIEAILQANDTAPGHYPIIWKVRGGNAVVDGLLAGKLDAVLIVGPAENPAIQKLADNDQLRLVSFRCSAAYETCLPLPKRVEVGESLLNLPRNVPERNISALSPVTTLVISERSHSALIPPVLEAVCEVMKDGSLFDKLGALPSAESRTLHLHEDVEYYYKSDLSPLQRHLLFRITSLVDRHIILLVPFAAIFIPLIKPIGPLYRWRIRACIYRWYRHTHNIDRKFGSGTDAEQLRGEIEWLERLENELNTVEVPLSYYHELYELHLRLDLVIKRLYGLQERQATWVEAGSLG